MPHANRTLRDPAIEGPFQIAQDRGFLPLPDPLARLPDSFALWEETARNLPKLLVAGKLRDVLDRLPILDSTALASDHEQRRAMLLLSFLGHGYVWGQVSPAARLPPGVAVPWRQVADRLGRPPVLSYASYALDNWRRLDPKGPIALGNIVLLQNFLGGIDEEWFVLVHVDIEAKAAPGLAAMTSARGSAAMADSGLVERSLVELAEALEGMLQTEARMPEGCDPYIYYHRVRPYIHGWKDQPALPNGLVYEGVAEYGGAPQRFRGETGAQSSIIPALDAALGIGHKDDPLRPYLSEMRLYMPPAHRAFIEWIEQGPSLRAHVLREAPQRPTLRDVYNECVRRLALFRAKHLEYAGSYIHRQAQQGHNSVAIGTGGTPFMQYLKKHQQETEEHLIR